MKKLISIMVLGIFGLNNAQANDIKKSIEISGGEIELSSGEKVIIGYGTFIPTPWDDELAKKILGYRSEIKFLNLEIDKINIKFEKYIEKTRKKEDQTKKYYQDKYKDVYLKNIILDSPWNKYGKTILWSVIAAAASIVTSWFICRETEKFGC